MADIKNTKELVKLVVALSGVFKTAMEDDKVDINDLALLVGIFPYVGGAIQGISEIPTELKDLDEAELKELSAEVALIIGNTTGENNYVEIIERSLKAGSEIYRIVKLLT